MFSDTHKEHSVERINKIYDKKMEEIGQKIEQLKEKIEKHENYLIKLSQIKDKLRKSKEDKGKELVLLY